MNERPDARLAAALTTGLTRRRLLRGAATALAGGGAGAALLALDRAGRPASAASTTGGIAEPINAYRVANGKPPIPVSPELTLVAKAHVQDLIKYFHSDPNYTTPGCSPHGWSSHGPWTGGCYNPNNLATAGPLMWNKPKEIARYPGNGYENLAGGANLTAAGAVALWAKDAPHNDVILNQGI